MNDPGTPRGRIAPYIADIRRAALPTVPASLLCAVGLRESLFGWAPGYLPRGTHLGFGDAAAGYAGWGIFQADRRTSELVIRGMLPVFDDDGTRLNLMTLYGQARWAARHLESSLAILSRMFPKLPPDVVRGAAVAAYNAPIGAVAAQLHAECGVDEVTTGRNYSRDVLARERALLAQSPELFKG